MARWGWRLFRREWRRQALVLALLVVAVAATTVALGVAANAVQLNSDPMFGTANTVIVLPAGDPNIAADIAAIQHRFGTVEVVTHQQVAVPGSVSSVDVRAEEPHGPYGHVTLRLDSGRFPTSAGEVAVTAGVAKLFGLQAGGPWQEGGRVFRVVGMVENPLNLLDEFALVAPGQASPQSDVSVLINAGQRSLQGFSVPSGTGLKIASRGTTDKTAVEALVLVLGTLGLLFVGLMAVAGFTVMAQRRLRALGMVGALGATDRHVRLVLVADGAAVGAAGALVGAALGLVGWFAFVPTLQSISAHRVDPFALPWWAVLATMAMAFATAVGASWWPARAVARTSLVAALSGRPPRPRPAHRFAALGGVVLAAGIVLLAFADRRRAGFIIGGTAATAVGLLFLAPAAIRALSLAAGRASVSVRLALRDLARYQARSGAALGAVTLATGVAATIAIAASAAEAPATIANLPRNQLVLYLTAAGAGGQVPPLTPAQSQLTTGRVDALAASIHASTVLPLEQAYDPRGTLQSAQPGPKGGDLAGYITPTLAEVSIKPHGEEITSPLTLYVATPAVLAHYGIAPNVIDPSADVITARHDLGGREVFDPVPEDAPRGAATPGTAPAPRERPPDFLRPKVQVIEQLPRYTSGPSTLLTAHAMRVLGLQPLPAAWLILTDHPLTAAQIDTARRAAAGAGLYVETTTAKKSLAPLRNWSTTAGTLVALGVLGMTVGLIRSETANDLRVLAATGATSSTRRTLTAATAGALAFLGAVLGTAGAYGALLAWYRSGLGPLGRVPVVNLLVLLIAFPALATVAGWLLAGREPPAIARRPLE
jgi:putative ABC transport system permease protein